ncbi:MAG: carboxypeptidase regulatory-like domain-containing protein [Planctomycetota bacterium]|nr:MAG: carboxypeptidase regulatory-like domain-containing protein [Planctomycetota bacterium]
MRLKLSPALFWAGVIALAAALALFLLRTPERLEERDRAAGEDGPAPASAALAPPAAEPGGRHAVREAASLGPAMVLAPLRELAEDELRGVVLDPKDQPLPGAEVLVSHAPAAGFGTLDLEYRDVRRLIASSRTDTRGEFRFPLESGPPYELDVRAPGLCTPRLVERHPGEYLEIRMSPAASLAGRVTRASDGEAVPDAYVRLFRYGGHREEYAKITHDDGTYRFADLAAGIWMMELLPEALQPPSWTEVRLEAGGETRRDFALAEGEQIVGVVIDAQTQRPIAGAEISESWTFDRVTRSDEDGSFVLAGAGSEDFYELNARAPGYGRNEMSLQEHKERPVQVRIELIRAHGASGRVLSVEGLPMAGVYVAAAASGWLHDVQGIDWQTARTQEDGRFEIAGLRADAHHVLFVRHEGFATLVYEFPRSEQKPAMVDLGDIVLPRGGQIAGVVVDGSEAPVPDAEVTVYGNNADRDRLGQGIDQDVNYYVSTREGRTDTRGRFRFSDLAAGQFRVSISVVGRPELPAQVVDLGEAEQRSDLRFVVPGGLEVSGVVRDPDGRPRAMVYVSLSQEDNRDDPVEVSQQAQKDGSFRFTGLPSGSYELGFHPYDWGNEDPRPRPVVRLYRSGIPAGTVGLEVTLPWAATIAGTVWDREGRPAAGHTVYAEKNGEWLDATETDENGEFQLTVEEGLLVDVLTRSRPREIIESALFEIAAARESGQEPAPGVPYEEVRLSAVAAGTHGILLRLP